MEKECSETIANSKTKKAIDKLCNIFSPIPPSPNSKIVIAKGDSAASKHYFAAKDEHVLHNVKDTPHGPEVALPDSSIIKASKTAELPLPNNIINAPAKKVAVFDHLQNSLISLGQLCDDGCDVLLNKKKLFAVKDKKLVLEGTRSKSGDGLWDIPISQPPKQSMNVIIRKNC